MRKDYLKKASVLFMVILLITGCQKENNPAVDFSSRKNHEDGCRLLSNSSEFGEYTYTYNQRGLVDQYYVPYFDGYCKMEYNPKGQLIKSRIYSGGVVVNTIVFFYHFDRVVKETWYDGETQTKVDETFYTYNRNGKATKSQSFIQDYTCIYKYSPEGNVLQWDLYFGGVINYSQQFTYLAPHHKPPFLAAHGLEYDFTTANGRYSENKWYSTSEKDIAYDENGNNPQVLLDQDPHQTMVQVNQHDYVTACDYFDILTQTYVHFKFDYENCGSDDKEHAQTLFSSRPAKNKFNRLQFYKASSLKSIKEQVKEFRSQYLKKQ